MFMLLLMVFSRLTAAYLDFVSDDPRRSYRSKAKRRGGGKVAVAEVDSAAGSRSKSRNKTAKSAPSKPERKQSAPSKRAHGGGAGYAPLRTNSSRPKC